MKITNVDTVLLLADIEKPFKDATFSLFSREQAIVRVFTDEGIVGIGEASQFSRAAVSATREIVEKEFRPLLLGKDPFDVEKLWEKMYLESYLYGRSGAAIIAMSGVEMSLWDIMGKALNLPVYKLLGGKCRDKIKAYATGGFDAPTDKLAREFVGLVEEGFRAVKMKIGYDFDKDIERVKTVREAIGPDIDLMVDGNMSYTPRMAIHIARKIEKYDISWFEEPIPPDDIEGMVKIASSVDMPLAAGENNYTRYGFEDLISRRAVDIVQADVARSGGLLECKKIASMAHTAGILCAPHGFGHTVGLAANVHFVVSTPNGFMVEVDQMPDPFRDELLSEPIEVNHGYIDILDKPGLGVELNERALQKYSLK